MDKKRIEKMFEDAKIDLTYGKYRTENHIYQILPWPKKDKFFVRMSYLKVKKFSVHIWYYTDLKYRIYNEKN